MGQFEPPSSRLASLHAPTCAAHNQFYSALLKHLYLWNYHFAGRTHEHVHSQSQSRTHTRFHGRPCTLLQV
jgi:hypothetical protein